LRGKIRGADNTRKQRKILRESKKAVGRRLKIIAGIIVVSVAVVLIFWALFPPAIPQKNKIAVIELRGELLTGEESIFYTTTGELQRSLENARRDKSIKAVILAVDSPGGYATASYEMYSMVKRFEKPVVAWRTGSRRARKCRGDYRYFFREIQNPLGGWSYRRKRAGILEA